jgi:hypothetical protein
MKEPLTYQTKVIIICIFLITAFPLALFLAIYWDMFYAKNLVLFILIGLLLIWIFFMIGFTVIPGIR